MASHQSQVNKMMDYSERYLRRLADPALLPVRTPEDIEMSALVALSLAMLESSRKIDPVLGRTMNELLASTPALRLMILAITKTAYLAGVLEERSDRKG